MRQWLFVSVAIVALFGGVYVYQSQQYDFATLQGERYEWQDFKGKWVVVNYFAEWCAPCLKEVPELNVFHQTLAKQSNVALFAVSYDPLTFEELSLVKQQYQMNFPLLDPQSVKYMPMEKPQYLPATYIIKPDGSVSKPLLGEQTAASLQQAINLLKESKA